MKNIMTQMLDALRSRVQSNLEIAHNNEKEIRQLLTEQLSNDRTQKLSNRFALSKRILEENKENLHIQNLIVNFLSKYKDVPNFGDEILAIKDFEQTISRAKEVDKRIASDSISQEPVDMEENNIPETHFVGEDKPPKNILSDSIFWLTANGKLKYNKAHPLYYDDKFYNNLLNHHIQREEYEICALLVKLDRGIK